MILLVVTILQLQCGRQSFEHGSLIYGSIIYRVQGETQPSFAYFEGHHKDKHPEMTACLQLKEKMDKKELATIALEPNGKRLLGLQ